MFTSFTIKNFRVFKDLTLAPLARVNLVAGKNNVGKTALLEALFLHIGPNNPGLSVAVHTFRGIQVFAADPQEMWGWLFNEKRADSPIELISRDEQGLERVLTIRLVDANIESISTDTTPTSGNGDASVTRTLAGATTVLRGHQFVLEYRDSAGVAGESRATLVVDQEKAGIQVKSAKLPPFPLGVFQHTHTRSPQEDAQRFSQLERTGRERDVVETLKLLEPRLRRLAVLLTGGSAMIAGDVGLPELIPVPLMGEGMARLLSLVLAIATARGGWVLVDEIENGLHHSVLLDVWNAISESARRNQTQIFATTHSRECIEAAHRAFRQAPEYEFQLIRLERIDGQIRRIGYDEESLEAAFEAELEVR